MSSDQRFTFLRAALANVPRSSILSKENPVILSASGRRYSVHLSPVHDSGEGRGNDDEQRIQVPRSVIETQAQRRDDAYEVLFLGFFPDGKAFTAWEPDYVLSLRAEEGGSVYARQSHEALALRDGAAVRVVTGTRYLGRSTTTIALPSSSLGAYLQHWQAMHRAATVADVLRLSAGS